MATEHQNTRVSLDEIVESVGASALRALESRELGRALAQKNGFLIDIKIRCGIWPFRPELGGQVGPVIEGE